MFDTYVNPDRSQREARRFHHQTFSFQFFIGSHIVDGKLCYGLGK